MRDVQSEMKVAVRHWECDDIVRLAKKLEQLLAARDAFREERQQEHRLATAAVVC